MTIARMSRLLTIPPPRDEALTPAQRKFNQLQQQLDQARNTLRAWDDATPLYNLAHTQRVLPLRLEAQELRRHTGLRVAALLDQTGWAKGERELLQNLLCELAREAIEDHGLDAAEQARWKTLHDEHAEESYDDANRAHAARLKRVVEEELGVDMGPQSFANEADLIWHARQRLREQQAAQQLAAEAKHAAPGSASAAPKRQTAAQKKRAAEREAVQQQAQASLRSVFRKLASNLHPDRADSDADRERRTALMQRVNAAYAAEDLLALLGLQLEIEQVDAEHLARATAAQLHHFNQVLEGQLDELRQQLQTRERGFCADFDLPYQGGLNPSKLGSVLNRAVNDWNAELFLGQRDFDALANPASAKRWLKKLKAEQRAALYL